MIDADKKTAVTKFVRDCERLLVRAKAADQDFLMHRVKIMLRLGRAALIDEGDKPAVVTGAAASPAEGANG
jgi:hypothetical protein